MTEPSFLASASDDEVPADGRRRTVVAVGALLSVALCAGGWLLLSGSSDADAGLGVPPGTPVAAAATPTPSPTVPAVEPVAVQDGRNPFRALYTAPEAAPADAGGVDGSTAEAAPAAPAAVGQAGTAPLAAPAAGPSATTPAPSRSLVLVRVHGTGESRTAVFRLDGAEAQVTVGDSFGGTGQLLLLSLQEGDGGAWTAVVQVGAGDPFDVVTGQPVTLP